VESKTGVVQSTYPERRFGYLSAGQEGGSAVYFSFDNVIGQNVMPGDRVRFVLAARNRALDVQLIPKVHSRA